MCVNLCNWWEGELEVCWGFRRKSATLDIATVVYFFIVDRLRVFRYEGIHDGGVQC